MNKLVIKIKNWVLKQTHRIPTRLPDGMKAFETWSKSLIDVYGFPDNDSVRFMFAAMIMSTKQTDAYVPKRFFALSGLAAASKEVAHSRMVELKEAQEARAKAEVLAKKQAEATANVQVASNVTSISS